jgi:hypothetical protein
MEEGRWTGRRNRSEKKEEVDEPKVRAATVTRRMASARAKERATVDDTGHLSASIHASPNVYGSEVTTPNYSHIR